MNLHNHDIMSDTSIKMIVGFLSLLAQNQMINIVSK